MIAKMTLEEFAAAVGSSASSPGGGAVAGVMLGLASACALKCVAITNAKAEKIPKAVAQRLQELAASGFGAADADARAFSTLMEAYRMPKDTIGNARRRDQTISAAAAACAVAGERMNEALSELIRIVEDHRSMIKNSMLNDIEACLHICESATNINEDNLRENRKLIV